LREIKSIFLIPHDSKDMHVYFLSVEGDQFVESHRIAASGVNQQPGFLRIVTHSSLTHETGGIFDDQAP
jgi:hypothetical protein